MPEIEIVKCDNEKAVIETLCDYIEKISIEAIETHSIFRVGLSGGSLTKYLASGMPDIRTDWSKWEFYLCDERYVTDSDPDSTYGVYKRTLMPQIPELKESQFVKINETLELDECAKDYEKQIRDHFQQPDGIPSFDLLLLGMGPDGHTCSLFPSHKLLDEKVRLVAPIDDSPKPPPKRVTMTYPLLNNSMNIIFAMAGAGKADMVKRVLKNKEPLPAGLAKPTSGYLIWILDNEAAAHL